MKASLKSKDEWIISFRDLCRVAYDGLWRTLLLLDQPDEALFTAERGRAQALVDGLKMQYGLTALPPVSFQPKETLSWISNEFSTLTVFLGRYCNTITFWVIGKGNKCEFRSTKIEGRCRDAITFLLQTTLENIGAGVGVRCEDRSLEPNDDSPSNARSDEEPAQTLQCTINAL